MAKNNKNKKGVSLIITLFIMIIILAVILSISTLLYSEIKVLRNVGNSVVGLYSADSGIEKVLYYDRQYQPNNGNKCKADSECSIFPSFPSCNEITKMCSMSVARGLCSMFLNSPDIKNSCSDGASGDPSIHCNGFNLTPTRLTRTDDLGCDPDKCDDCIVSFNTTLDSGTTPFDATNYFTTARVYTEGSINKFEISSKGDFGGASRQIQIVIDTTTESSSSNPSAPVISNVSANCDNPPKIKADVTDNDGVATVKAIVSGQSNDMEILTQQGKTGTWWKPWQPVSGGTYNITITAVDNLNNSGIFNLPSFTCP